MKRALVGLTLVLAMSACAQADYIAYQIPLTTGTGGNSEGLTLGMYFDVVSDIQVTELGAFDSQDGGIYDDLTGTITVHIYNRDTGTSVASLTFSPGDSGTLNGGHRFKALATSLELSAGFHGCIAAYGYGQAGSKWEPNYGSFADGNLVTTDDGDGLISFTGSGGRYGVGDVYPGSSSGFDNVNPYGAGTFTYVPEPATMSLLGLGGLAMLIRRKRK